jgi:site-specific DNA-methyltransferase (adenine-specific)
MVARRYKPPAYFGTDGVAPLFNTESMLILGDNLETLPIWVASESVDLVYLDPPFNSNATYNMLFKHVDGAPAAAQIQAFTDTWKWNAVAAASYDELLRAGGDVARVMHSFWGLLDGPCDMLAYLSMMAPRLVELRRVLKPTGSIYLHCDPTASHYLKLLLDAVFGPEQFRNEIIWRRTGAHAPKRKYGPIHDTLLFYSRTDDYWWDIVRSPYSRDHVKRRYTEDAQGRMQFTSGGNVLTGAGKTKGESGATWRGFDPGARNRHWAVPGFLVEQMPPDFELLGVIDKLDALYTAGLIEITPGNVWPVPVRFLEPGDGQPLSDIWAYQPGTEGDLYGTEAGIDSDVAWMGPTDPERLGYPTQKPLGLLERIIRSSCPQGGIVLDPFCGCGTTIDEAQRLGRQWIGVDVSRQATDVIEGRLHDQHPRVTWQLRIFPPTIEEAERLAETDRHAFQEWACYRIGATPSGKGADRGIDGTIDGYVDGDRWRALVSVKSGKHVGISELRDLLGTVEREKAQAGIFITLTEPPRTFARDVTEAGIGRLLIPKLQVLSIAELFAGKRPIVPAPHGVAQFDAEARTVAEDRPVARRRAVASKRA